jgi:hypothetical protein
MQSPDARRRQQKHPTRECAGRQPRDPARYEFKMAFEQCEIRPRLIALSQRRGVLI